MALVVHLLLDQVAKALCAKVLTNFNDQAPPKIFGLDSCLVSHPSHSGNAYRFHNVKILTTMRKREEGRVQKHLIDGELY